MIKYEIDLRETEALLREKDLESTEKIE